MLLKQFLVVSFDLLESSSIHDLEGSSLLSLPRNRTLMLEISPSEL